MDSERVVVVGASAGGIEALKQVLGGLSSSFPAPIAVVVHLAPNSTSVLPEVLSRACKIGVRRPRSGEAIERGVVYVAPPDHHLLLRDGTVHLSLGPRENHQRPAIDPLFRSAAREYGPGAIGVILSGNLDDGTAGLVAIYKAGGLAVVQSPEDATHPDMPTSARASVPMARVVPAKEMGALLEELVRAPRSAQVDRMPLPLDEDRIADFDALAAREIQFAGRPSTFVCPDCGGTLFTLESGELERYRCRVGHAYSIDSLYAEKQEHLEGALWAALRALEEHADLARKAGMRARAQHLDRAAERFEHTAADDEERARVIRSTLRTERDLEAPTSPGPAEDKKGEDS